MLTSSSPLAVSAVVPRGADAAVPNLARVYDCLPGGRDDVAAGRRAARELARLVPQAATAARENGDFLRRAVRFLACEAGIGQYPGIGAGLPAHAGAGIRR